MDMKIREDLKYYAKLAQRKLGLVAGQIELTSKCFQRCTACDSWKADAKGEISGTFEYDKIVELCGQLNAMPTFEHLSFTGGDPQHWEYFDVLLSAQRPKWHFTTQANTALAKDPDWSLWREKLDRVRVSLDGASREVYRKMRGVDVDPEEIVNRMEMLGHPMLATNTCVTDLNIHEVPRIIERLNRMHSPPRKAMFLAVLDFKVSKDFWGEYRKLKEISSPIVPTSFSEDVSWVREFTKSAKAKEIPCYAGAITFHIKADGNVYPCCLVGGEAIKTRPDMAIGNVFQDSLQSIHDRYIPALHYANPKSPCVEVCQWKQLQVNIAGWEASKTTLAMP